jgi:PKD repeat protein
MSSRMGLSTLVALVLLTASADAVTVREQCREVCADEIAACVEQGGRPRACRRQTIRLCREQGVAVCLATPTDPLALGIKQPASVTATPVSSSAIALAWLDTSTKEVGYEIERSLTGTTGSFTLIATTGVNARSFQDGALSPATTYYYRLRALGPRGGHSSYSAIVAATTFSLITTTSTTIRITTTSSTVRSTTTSTTIASSVNQAPVAKAGPDQFTSTLTAIAFSGSASSDPDGTISAYSWTFGDGASAAGVSASHAYATAGTYTVTLRVTDNGGASASDTAVISVANRPPVANAGPDKSVVAGTAVTLSGSGSDPDGTVASYAWNAGDGATGTGASMAHAYAAPGTYTASFTVTDNLGARSTDTASVVVTAVSNGGALRWSNSAGNTEDDRGRAVALDGAGNIFATGQFRSTINLGGGPMTAFKFSYQPDLPSDIYLVKYSPSGAHLWSKRIGGHGDDSGTAIAIDGSGNVIVAGFAGPNVDFGGGELPTAGSYDVFVAKYAGSDGHYLWAKRFGGPTDEYPWAIALDASGNVLVTGEFTGTVNFGGGPLISAGDRDVFVAKYAGADGGHLWSRRSGAALMDVGNGIDTDASGNVFVTGFFQGTVDFGGGSFTSAGDRDVFVAKYAAASGQHLWSKRLGSTSIDEGSGLAVDPSGEVIVTGSFVGTVDFGGGPISTPNLGSDVFLVKYSTAGVHRWSKRLGGTNGDSGKSIAADGNGNVTVTGAFQGAVDFGGGALTSAGSFDIFVAQYAGANGQHVWSRRYGGTGNDRCQAVAASTGSVAVTGYFPGTVNFGDGARTSAGSNDIFLFALLP